MPSSSTTHCATHAQRRDEARVAPRRVVLLRDRPERVEAEIAYDIAGLTGDQDAVLAMLTNDPRSGRADDPNDVGIYRCLSHLLFRHGSRGRHHLDHRPRSRWRERLAHPEPGDGNARAGESSCGAAPRRTGTRFAGSVDDLDSWYRLRLRLDTARPVIGITVELIDAPGIAFTHHQNGVVPPGDATDRITRRRTGNSGRVTPRCGERT